MRIGTVIAVLLLAAWAGPATADSAGLKLGGRVGTEVSLTPEATTLADGTISLDLVGRSNSADGYKVLLLDRQGQSYPIAAEGGAHALRALRARVPDGAAAEGLRLVIRSN